MSYTRPEGEVSGILTVGALRAALSGVADDMPVMVHMPDDLDPGDWTVIESAAPDGTCNDEDVFRLTLADDDTRFHLAISTLPDEAPDA